VLMIVIGGMEYILGATPFQKGDGKERIINAFTGLILALAAYLILVTISPRLVDFNLNLDPARLRSEPTASTSAPTTPAAPQYYGSSNPYNVTVLRNCGGGADGYTYQVEMIDNNNTRRALPAFGPFSTLAECQTDMTNLQQSLRGGR
jgi:hypothetical protein